jgi:hypothetical protein
MSFLHEPEFQAWNVLENQFPQDETKTEQLKFLLDYAKYYDKNILVLKLHT